LSKIVSIGTAVPEFRHDQSAILEFMEKVYAPTDSDRRKLKFLYKQGGIDTRYSVIPDYSLPAGEWRFYPPTENLEPFPKLEKRMEWFENSAAPLSLKAINNCLVDIDPKQITHLVTVSCTGMSAPGLDLQLIEALDLSLNIVRSPVNFMGCYAAIHGLRIADAFCKSDPQAKVLVVCTELCTLHFQREASVDNITSSMLFSDGSAAVLVTAGENSKGFRIGHFFSSINLRGKKDMAWQLSSKGFVMNLSSYIPDIIEEDFNTLVSDALKQAGITKEDINHWCIHPGGKKILESVHNSLGFSNGQLENSYDVLKNYGNMSSASVLFVLERIMKQDKNGNLFMAAFGPGLTMETALLSC
jgi:predicted naringenin-chalcone synthase